MLSKLVFLLFLQRLTPEEHNEPQLRDDAPFVSRMCVVVVLFCFQESLIFVCSCRTWTHSTLERIPDMDKKTSFKKRLSYQSVSPFPLSSSPPASLLLPTQFYVSAENSRTCR